MRRLPPAFFFCAVVLVVGAHALESPLPASAAAATFGSPSRGRVLLGLLLADTAAPSGGSAVRAAAPGELVFAREAENPHTSLPSALGAFVAVEHQRGILGLYSGLAPGSAAGYLSQVKTGDLLGASGRSGWSEGPGLLFSLWDREAGRWVNPLLFLPPMPDQRQPAIRSAALGSGSRVYVLGETRSVPQGSYTVSVDVADPQDAPWSLPAAAPYSVRLLVDGRKVAELAFDVAEYREGGLSLARDGSKAGFRGPDGRIVLLQRHFPRGRTLVELLVRDHRGNERQASWTVTFE